MLSLVLLGCANSGETGSPLCGGTSGSSVRGIRNGDPAPTCAFQSVAFLDLEVSAADHYFCSGTLIRPNVVLTAGHCVTPPGVPGHHSMKVTFPGRSVVTSTQQIVHPQYSPTGTPTGGIDVALVFLPQPLNDLVPVPLASSLPSSDAEAFAYGYGYDGRAKDGNGSLGRLLVGTLKILSTGIAIIAQAQTQKSQETCEGDSGGPLIFNAALIGVLSGGNATGDRCDDGTDSAYTSISAALPWINSSLTTSR